VFHSWTRSAMLGVNVSSSAGTFPTCVKKYSLRQRRQRQFFPVYRVYQYVMLFTAY